MTFRWKFFWLLTLIIGSLQCEEGDFLSFLNKSVSALDSSFKAAQSLQGKGPSFINSVYVILDENGREYVIKLSNPVWQKAKTCNEVFALQFLQDNASIPVPEIFLYENRAEQSPIGFEYIVMPKIKGRPLSSEIDRLYEDKAAYHDVLNQLADIVAEMQTCPFDVIGNFARYENQKLVVAGIVDFANYALEQPCKAYSEYARHALSYYVQELEEKMQQREENLFYNQISSILLRLKNLVQLGNFSFLDKPTDRFVLSHQDFVMKNILVDQSKVTAILDWEWSGAQLAELEHMTGFDFLISEDDVQYFDQQLQQRGIYGFFSEPPPERQLFYHLMGEIYSLVAFEEWQEGRLEHTAKFLTQKLEQRKIRAIRDFDMTAFLTQLLSDLDQDLQAFSTYSLTVS